MELLTDNPILSVGDDRFGRAHFVQILREVILQTGPLPFCVGIYGEWGSGKSSFMRMLETSFTKEAPAPGVKAIWFNPWKYDTKEELWRAFLQSVISKIQEDSKESDTIREKAIELSKSLAWLSLRKFVTTVTGGLITDADQKDIVASLAAQDLIYHKYINEFENMLKEIVQDFVYDERTGEDGRLIIFIDDLDRCLPENAITVLESLKLFFDNTQCIFVLGMDHYIVEAGIKHRYQEKLDMRGRDYLDKIVQIPFYLPPVPFEDIKKALNDPVNRPFMTPAIWNIMELGMGSNPRKNRRFINSFSLSQWFLKRDSLAVSTRVMQNRLDVQNTHLAQLLVFQMVFTDFYHHLWLFPDDWSYVMTSGLLDDVEHSEEFLEKKKDLAKVWDNQDLQRFLRKTAVTQGYPPAPDARTVDALLQITKLVVPTSNP